MPSRARGSFGVVAVNLHLPRDGQQGPECAKGRDQAPAPATNLPAEGRVRQDGLAGGPVDEGRVELEAGALAGRGGSVTSRSPPWSRASRRAMRDRGRP